jgi:predicted RNA-binding Zn-ribbon protein involved in translation (DUF1610 family)
MEDASYVVERPPGEERGIQVTCTAHDESEEFEPGQNSVAFYCPGCGLEIEAAIRADDWRDLGEIC